MPMTSGQPVLHCHDLRRVTITPPRFLLYSHDGFGIGHFARNLRVGAALARSVPDASVLLVCGLQTHVPLPPGVDVLKLPSMRKAGRGDYKPRSLRLEPDAVHRLRQALLEQTVREFEPDVVLVDRHPDGLAGELRSSMDIASEAGAALALGLRDVLDEPTVVADEWPEHVQHDIAERFDEVLVYGEQEFLDFAVEYGLPAQLASKLRYCGLVGPGGAAEPRFRRRRDDGGAPFVVASVGGGQDGHQLLALLLEASVEAGWRGVALTGSQMSASDRLSLQPLAEASDMRLLDESSEVAELLQRADVSVSMAGANTVSEILAAGCRSVLLPRTEPRTEQLIRARLLEESGRAIVVHPDDATPDRVRLAVEQSLATEAPQPVELNGADRAALALADLAARRTELRASA